MSDRRNNPNTMNNTETTELPSDPPVRSMRLLGVRRFPNVYAALDGLRRSQNPAHQSEAEVAMKMIWGERPGIEEKYDALLLKLDRSYSNLTDKRDHWKSVAEESPLANTRKFAKAKVAALNVLLTDLQWMRARNRDMIAAVASTPNAEVSHSRPTASVADTKDL